MDGAAVFVVLVAIVVGLMAFALKGGRRGSRAGASAGRAGRAGPSGNVSLADRNPGGARLRVVQGPLAGTAYALPPNGLTIGRDPGNGVCIAGMLVSRRHARVFMRNGQWTIEDADSTNGTWVNQRKVVSCALRPGDVIAVGPAQFVLDQPGEVRPGPNLLGPLNAPGRDSAAAWLEDEAGQRTPVLADGLCIGRNGDNQLRPQNDHLSRYHARLWRQAQRWVLTDLRSSNGTWVNNRRIQEQELADGDHVVFGSAGYRFHCEPASSLPGSRPDPAPVPVSALEQKSRNGFPPQPSGGGAVSRPISQPNRGAGEGPVPAFVTGQRLGAYMLTQFIGSGGAAHVYKGISPQTGQPVAVKVLVNTDPYVREKFEQEGRLGRKLVHPHIARVLDCSQANGVYFVVMEYVDGGSLRNRLIPGRPAELDLVCMVMRDTGSALAYAHEHGIVHRDVKPENIMLSSSGGVKLVDFGIARFTQEVTFTSSGMIIGTPYYMSPEQARGDPIDRRTDVYSLGVVMYEMLTGCVPFDGPPLSVARQHIEEPPPVKPLLGAGVSPRLQEVVLLSLAKNPGNRYATASALATAVQTAVT